MTKGIVLLAFSSHIYGRLAFNQALSIKYHSPTMPIHLVYEPKALNSLLDYHKSFFDTMQEIDHEDMFDEKFNPGKAKASLYKYLPFDHNIFLDVDGCIVKPIEPLFDLCISKGGYFYTQLFGKYDRTKGDKFPEMYWAKPDDIWKFYGLKETNTLMATNSSFMYIKKGKLAKAFFAKYLKNQTVNRMPAILVRKWGNSYPDELAMNVAMTQSGIDGDLGITPLLFAQKTLKEKADNYFGLGLFGGRGFSGKDIIDLYDRYIHKYSVERLGTNQQFKYHHMVAQKHAGRRN